MPAAPSTSSPLPPVERVRPGLWSIPVPIPSSSLRYVFVYVFETDAGPYIVDTGWNTDDAFAALSAGLTQLGSSIGAVQGVLVTHIHPDHYGLAGRVREASGAWIALHPADAALIQDRYEEPTELLGRVGAMLRRMGAPPAELAGLQAASMPVRGLVDAVQPDVLVEDGERPDVPGWNLAATCYLASPPTSRSTPRQATTPSVTSCGPCTSSRAMVPTRSSLPTSTASSVLTTG